MAKRPYDQFIPEIRELADSIKNGQLDRVRDMAHREWLAHSAKDKDLVAQSWAYATLIVLAANGYEIKKKT